MTTIFNSTTDDIRPSGGALVLVVDDQPHLVVHPLQDAINIRGAVANVQPISTVDELRNWLETGVSPPKARLDGHSRPTLVVIDLYLGPNGAQSTGLNAIKLLRSHDLTKQIPIVLNSSHISIHSSRLPLALAAELAGGSIWAGGKDEHSYTAIALWTKDLIANPRSSFNQVENAHLRRVQRLTIQDGNNSRFLGDALFNNGWQSRYWEARGDGLEHGAAMERANYKARMSRENVRAKTLSTLAAELGRIPTGLSAIESRLKNAQILGYGPRVDLGGLIPPGRIEWKSNIDVWFERYREVLSNQSVHELFRATQ